jgi:hypothetical protein
MEKIRQQVATARRRMVAQQFFSIVGWSLFATLLIAAIGLAIPKIWVLQVDPSIWTWSWLGGSLGVGLLIATVWTYIARHAALEAAIEIDRRFQLKERVSSALSLSADELESEAGRALIDDAERRVNRIDVRDSFPVRFSWRTILPLVPALVIFVLVTFVDNATPKKQVQAAAEPPKESEQVKRSAKELQKRLERAKKEAEEKDLEDAELLFKQIHNGIEELANRSNVDRKKALAKFNNLAQTIEERRKRFGGADQMREKLNQLKDVQQGPADKIAQAMKQGDFKKALDELKNLQEKLKNDELNEEEKEQLTRQLEQLQNKLQDMVDAHDQAKRDLEQEIQRRKDSGDLEGAGKLQRQLDQLNQMNDQMNQLQKMADNLGQCQQCVQNGDTGAAAGQMDQLADTLQDLQNQIDQLETLDQMLDEIAMAKESMNCGMCDGEGCEGCMGQMFSVQQGQRGKGIGLGDGQGEGARPEERTGTNFYDSQVRGKVQPGEAVRTGTASGPNRAGQTLEEVKEQLRSSTSEDADPLIDVRLPRKEREHAREYLNRIRTGE